MSGILDDVRYAFRALRRAPVFASLAVVSLALGIGANTAIFSLIDSLLLRRLPVDAPDRLVTLEQVLPDGSRLPNFSVQDAERFARLTNVFANVSATTWADGYNVAIDGDVDERLARVSIVTGSFFDTLGLHARLGRALASEDDRIDGASPVVVISDGYWQRRFNRAPDAIGRTLRLNRTTYTVVGVMPKGFTGDWIGWPTDLWIPVAMAPQVFGESAPGLPRGMRRQFKLIARLVPGVSAAAARAATEPFYKDLQANPPPEASGVSKASRLDLVSAAAGYSPQRQTFAQPLAALMAAVGAVLLIACANVANLLLARTAARRREIAIRIALGATRVRIVRLVLMEGLVLAILAGAIGLLAASWETAALADLARSGPVGSVNFGAQLVDLDVRLDARTLLFTIALCLLTPILFALAPGWQASGRAAGPALSQRGIEGGGPEGWFAARKLLVIGQVAVSLALIAGTGLLVRSLINLKSQQLGFTRQHLLLAWTLPSATGRQGQALLDFAAEAQQRIASVPGVVSVSLSAEGLLAGGPTGGPLVRPRGALPSDAARVEATMTVGPSFFGTIGQPVIAGRDFSNADTASSPPAAIVNQTLATRVFGATNAVGQQLLLGPGDASAVEIVGVVADAAHHTPRTRAQRVIYYPAAQNVRRLRSMCLAVKTAGDDAAVAAQVRTALRALDPQLPIMKIDTLDEQLDAVLFQDRLITNLAVTFGALAALLAGAGLCAMLFFVVARRTKEIGVRVALGASRATVLRTIVGDTFALVLIGIGLGLPLALWAGASMAPRLFGVTPRDPLTMAGAVLIICAISLAAAAAPARRATAVDPMVALRTE
jgi:predicted permease